MIAYIKGILVQSSIQSVIIETRGMGHRIFIPFGTFNRLPPTGQDLLLHTSFIVRELAQTLYGFLTEQERDFFEALLNVTGIGPKIALALIGHMSVQELQSAISREDIAALCRVPGIGKKGAERLIIEMRDKVRAIHDPRDFQLSIPSDPSGQRLNDAMSVLMNLGYNQQIAQNALKKALNQSSNNADLANLITDALKYV